MNITYGLRLSHINDRFCRILKYDLGAFVDQNNRTVQKRECETDWHRDEDPTHRIPEHRRIAAPHI